MAAFQLSIPTRRTRRRTGPLDQHGTASSATESFPERKFPTRRLREADYREPQSGTLSLDLILNNGNLLKYMQIR